MDWIVSDNRPWARDVASVELHHCSFLEFHDTTFDLRELLSLEDCVTYRILVYIRASMNRK